MLHLEAPAPEDEARFAEVNHIVLDWIGGTLKWSLLSSFSTPEPFDVRDVAYLPLHAASLMPGPAASDPDGTGTALHAKMVASFALACHGGTIDIDASPFSYRFYAEVPDRARAERLEAPAMLRITVPSTWPLADFRARILAIARKLRVRWGVAGLTYSGWEIDRPVETFAAICAHSRRFAGYDVGLYAGLTDAWHERMRTVSWLTFVGPAFMSKLRGLGVDVAPTKNVSVESVADGVVLQAGAQPEEGDLNRLRLPPAYVQADEMVRPVRAHGGLGFKDPWTDALTERWLRRFEKRIY
jgi:hypothetical protein